MGKHKTIQSKLFVNYSLLMVSVIALLSITYYFYTANILRNNASDSMQRLSLNITEQLNTFVRDLDNTAEKVIFSPVLKEIFFKPITGKSHTLQDQRNMNAIIYSIMGPLMTDWQINLIDMNGKVVGFGNSSFSTTFDKAYMDRVSWVADTIAADGRKVILSPHQDNWGSSNWVVSIARAFREVDTSSQLAVVEVQVDYQSLSKLIAKLTSSTTQSNDQEIKISIYDQFGNSIFPLDANLEEDEAFQQTLQTKKTVGNLVENGNILSFSYSDYTHWTVIVSESERVLLRPVVNFRNYLLLSLIGLLLLTLVVSFVVAKNLSRPIRRMYRSVQGTTIENLGIRTAKGVGNQLNELDILESAYNRMAARLKISIEEAVLLRTHEMQAKMLAMQSQMNPHFLYNIITIISILADEKGQKEIVKICTRLTTMLRYILSNMTAPVALSDEIAYAEHFLELMAIRYKDMLDYKIAIDPQIRSIPVFKLLIQPIVENSIKHGIHVRPPWRIEIQGMARDGNWMIEIRDNGTGFTDEVLDAFAARRSLAEVTSSFEPLASNQIGLFNIYSRLKLLYGEKAIFVLSNHEFGGAIVIVGGPIQEGCDR